MVCGSRPAPPWFRLTPSAALNPACLRWSFSLGWTKKCVVTVLAYNKAVFWVSEKCRKMCKYKVSTWQHHIGRLLVNDMFKSCLKALIIMTVKSTPIAYKSISCSTLFKNECPGMFPLYGPMYVRFTLKVKNEIKNTNEVRFPLWKTLSWPCKQQSAQHQQHTNESERRLTEQKRAKQSWKTNDMQQ